MMEQRLSDEGVSEIMKRQGSLSGYLIPPEFTPELMRRKGMPAYEGCLIPPKPLTDEEIERIKAEFEAKYYGNPSSPAILLPTSVGFAVEAETDVCGYVELSPREESLLREAPVFRTSPLEEPQPDVIVKPKESQC